MAENIYNYVCINNYVYIATMLHLRTYMQFLAAKSLCTICLEERYSIPLAISSHIFISKL